MDHMPFNTIYLEMAVNHIDRVIDEAKRNLAHTDFDTMIGTGMSGCIVIPRLADAMGKHWFLVRKQTENSHSKLLGEGKIGRKWLFVDDLIATGKSAMNVRAAIVNLTAQTEWVTEFVGAYVYGGEGRPAGFWSIDDIDDVFERLGN